MSEKAAIDWTAIRAEYESGSSLRAVAAKYNVSKTYIIEKRNKEQWNRPTTSDRPPTTPLVEIDARSTPKKDLSTKDKQRLFLDAYAEQANVMVAAKMAGIHRTTVYVWLETDEDFSFAYNQAKEDAKDTLRAEIYRRGKEGWDEPVYQMGYLAGKVRKYSDTLLIFHAKMLMAEYRDKQQLEVTGKDGGPIQVNHSKLSDEELATLEDMWKKANDSKS